MNNKINILLDSNIRNKFYKEINYHDDLIAEIKYFSQKKLKIPLNYTSPFSYFEEAGFGKLENLEVSSFSNNLEKLNSTIIGSEEEAILLFDMAEKFLIDSLQQIKNNSRYNLSNIINLLSNKMPFINNDELKKRYFSDYITDYKDDDLEVLHGCLAFEFLQDKFLQSKINPEKRALFLLSLFYHFLAEYRDNSLFRSAHGIWTESFSKDFLSKNPEFKNFFNQIETKFKVKSREDFVDNELVHYAVMGKRKVGSKIKFLVLTNDPIENVLLRISLYKFTIINATEIGLSLPRPVYIPKMNFGYVGHFNNNKIRWISVAEIPPIGLLETEDDISKIAARFKLSL